MSDSTQPDPTIPKEKPVESEKKPEQPSTPPEQTEEEMVSRTRLDGAVNDMMSFKKRATEAEDKLKANEMNDLKKREEWKEVARISQEETAEAKKDSKLLRESIVFEKKKTALQAEAIKIGIRKEALQDIELMDFDDVGIETTSSGGINVIGADLAIQKIKTLRPHWFGGKTGNVNSLIPEVVQGSGIEYKDIVAAEKKAKETGDYAPYYKVMKQYKSQHQ